MGSSSLKMIIIVLILARVNGLLEAPQSVHQLLLRYAEKSCCYAWCATKFLLKIRLFTEPSLSRVTINFARSNNAKVDYSPTSLFIRGPTMPDRIACFGKTLGKFGFALNPYDLGVQPFPVINQSGTINCAPRYQIRSVLLPDDYRQEAF